MPVVGLGHTGLWVDDLEKMRDFYERVIGLTVTDEDDEQGIVFFSAQPDVEHHEFVLQRLPARHLDPRRGLHPELRPPSRTTCWFPPTVTRRDRVTARPGIYGRVGRGR